MTIRSRNAKLHLPTAMCTKIEPFSLGFLEAADSRSDETSREHPGM